MCNGKWQGCPTTETRCGANQVTSVPSSVRRILGRYAYHYTKYTHAYGIPILGSGAVSNAAFARACYMHKVLLADNPKIRDWMCYVSVFKLIEKMFKYAVKPVSPIHEYSFDIVLNYIKIFISITSQ